MLKFCVYQWNLNKDNLRACIERDKKINSCDYKYLVELVVRTILNGEFRHPGLQYWDWSEIADEIDHSCYQGVKLFVVHRTTASEAHEYLLTSVSYGSCSVCDTLYGIQALQPGYGDELPTKKQVDDYMTLCKDIVCGFVHPFPSYWGEADGWQHMTVEE